MLGGQQRRGSACSDSHAWMSCPVPSQEIIRVIQLLYSIYLRVRICQGTVHHQASCCAARCLNAHGRSFCYLWQYPVLLLCKTFQQRMRCKFISTGWFVCSKLLSSLSDMMSFLKQYQNKWWKYSKKPKRIEGTCWRRSSKSLWTQSMNSAQLWCI